MKKLWIAAPMQYDNGVVGNDDDWLITDGEFIIAKDMLKEDAEDLAVLYNTQDVTDIMLQVVPGYDGMGVEIYAKNTDEVVAELTKLSERLDETLDDNRKLRIALEWYGAQAEGCRKLGSIGEPFRNALDRDGGKLAHDVLKAVGLG